MKRAALPLVAAMGLLLACLYPAPRELMDARLAYDRAANSQTRMLAPDELAAARRALNRAESQYERAPTSQSARDLAYVAQRRVQIAESRARMTLALRDRASAEQQLAASQSRTASELSEARAKLQAQEEERRRQAAEQAELARRQEELAHQDQRDQLTRAQQQLDDQRRQLQARQQELEEARKQQAQAEAERRDALQQLQQFAKVREEQRGTVITLSSGLLFAPGRSDLSPDAQRALDQVARALETVPEQHVVVEGHTDTKGDEDFNYELSVFRANAVKDFLASRGVDRSRVEAVGFGETRPVASNQSAEGRATNRRVEIVVQRGVGGSAAPVQR
ncbi:MAG TPA: OmpA family protein [Myxococcaceae bacterium]|jgi:outer membrane protein OmpA-like peptidoglycan-associated protein